MHTTAVRQQSRNAVRFSIKMLAAYCIPKLLHPQAPAVYLSGFFLGGVGGMRKGPALA